MTALAQLAALALTELRRRQASALRKIAAGQLERPQAERLLRPWAAIACRLGADFAELEPLLAARRDPDERVSMTRACLADDICPRSVWAPALAAARDAAVDRSEAAAGNAAHKDLVERARALVRLADHFGRDPNRDHPVYPYLRPHERTDPEILAYLATLFGKKPGGMEAEGRTSVRATDKESPSLAAAAPGPAEDQAPAVSDPPAAAGAAISQSRPPAAEGSDSAGVPADGGAMPGAGAQQLALV